MQLTAVTREKAFRSREIMAHITFPTDFIHFKILSFPIKNIWQLADLEKNCYRYAVTTLKKDKYEQD